MNIDDVEAAWNAQADEYNQWLDLDANEMVEFTLKISASHEGGLLAVSEKLCKIYFDIASDAIGESEVRRLLDVIKR